MPFHDIQRTQALEQYEGKPWQIFFIFGGTIPILGYAHEKMFSIFL